MFKSMEGVGLMLHFCITLAILAGYVYTLITGHPDETLRNLLILIGGYWFGVLNQSKISKMGGKPDDKQ